MQKKRDEQISIREEREKILKEPPEPQLTKYMFGTKRILPSLLIAEESNDPSLGISFKIRTAKGKTGPRKSKRLMKIKKKKLKKLRSRKSLREWFAQPTETQQQYRSLVQ